MTEQERFDLYKQLSNWLGPVPAGTLMENLPPISWDQIATKADLNVLGKEMAAQGSALRGEMSELRGDLRSEMSEHRSDMSDFRSELRSDMSDFRTELRTEMSDFRTVLTGDFDDFRTELLGSQANFYNEVNSDIGKLRSDIGESRIEFDDRFGQLEERISDKISSAQRTNLVFMVGLMASILLSTFGI